MKTEVELRHLRVFVSVVELGGHTRAARSLGISQSTVSETLSALERTLGTALFRKAAKGSTLTPSGEALLPYARRILALTGELVTELANVTTNVSATLMVGAVEPLSAYVLHSRLAALRERWPKVRVEVMTGLCSEIRESVAAGKSDLGLVLEADTRAEDGSILSKARLLIFGSPAHPLVHRRASPDELRRCDFFMSDAAGNYHQVLRQYFEGAQVPLPRTQALGSIEGLKRWILAEVSVSPALPGLVLRAVSSTEGTSSPIIDDLIQSLRGLSLRG